MRRWIALAANFYPQRWRERYGDEFLALLEDVRPTWRMCADVWRGAIQMQLRTGTAYWKLAGAMAVVGAIVAAGVSFSVPPRYVSSAILQITPTPDPVRPALALTLQDRAASQVAQMEEEILSRGQLAAIITNPSFDLYRGERARQPMEDIVLGMRNDIRIEPIGTPTTTTNAPMAFRVSFAYPDQWKARAVTRKLVTTILERNVWVNQYRARMWETFWRDEVAASHAESVTPAPTGLEITVLDPASLPEKPLTPNRATYMAWGLGAGLLLGLLAAIALRRRHGVRQLAGFAVAGCALAGAASFLIPDRYTSTAVMRITPPMITEDPLAMPVLPSVAERLQVWKPQILSRANLARMIQHPRLDLYPKERTTTPLEEVIAKMLDRDIRIAPMNPAHAVHAAPGAFTISFSYPDPAKAQAVVRELVTAFAELNITQARASAPSSSSIRKDLEEHKAGENLEVLDPASLPQAPIAPDRLAIAAAGLALGLLLGVTILWRRSSPTPAPSM
jgi:uncharacterized protein involved in exopolysaccharide biosynthesis